VKQILLTIFLVLLIAIFASAGIQLSDNTTRKGTGFNILTHLSMVGDTVGDSSCDDNNDLKIDRNWLDVYDSIGIDVDGGAFDYWLRPAYFREGANITFTVNGDTLTIAGSGGGSGSSDTTWLHNDANNDSISSVNNAIHLKWGTGIDVTIAGDTATASVDKSELSLAFSDLSGSATDGQIPNNITIDISTDVETTGTKISTALTNRTTDTEFGKVTDDTSNWNSAYVWADTAQDSVRTWDNLGYPQASTSALGIASFSSTNFTVSSGAVSITTQTITKTAIDSTSSNIPFDGAYHITTASADSAYMSKKYIDTQDGKFADDTTALIAAKDSVAAWDNGDIFKKNVQSWDFIIVLPKNVSDSVRAIPIKQIEDDWAPNGVYVHRVGIKTDNSSTYSVRFAEYSAPNTAVNDIDTITTSSSYEAEGTPSDTAIAVGNIIYVIIPTTTGTKTLHGWITWYKQ
jgi:hypothetical protein